MSLYTDCWRPYGGGHHGLWIQYLNKCVFDGNRFYIFVGKIYENFSVKIVFQQNCIDENEGNMLKNENAFMHV